jgi:hypothetical protein
MKETDMKLLKNIAIAAALSAACAGVAQAHPFIGVGIVGGPVFPVASANMSAPPLPVYPHALNAGPAPLPSDAPPVTYVQPAVANIASIMGHGGVAGAQPSL